MQEVKEVKSIKFGISSTEDIRNKSVYESTVSKYHDDKTNTVYDHRSGSLFNKKCETCKEYEHNCPGHFSHIELNSVIVHPLFFSHVFNILKIICHKCSKLLITREHLEFGDIIKLEGDKRLSEIINKLKKFNKCFHCDTLKREYKIKKDPFFNIIQYEQGTVVKEISDDEIKRIFDDIDNETLELIKMDHPKKYCLEAFPVIPPCCRPYEFVGNTIKEDDLTKQLVEIIKANNNVLSSTDKKMAIHNLKFKIESFCRTPKKKTKNINIEPIKGIRERLTGKEGQLRDNLMGKRTEMAARTVIGPGPNLQLDEVGIPEAIARNITFPINVYKSNYNEIIDMIKNKKLIEKVKRQDKIIRLDLQMYSDIINFLNTGDVILRDGNEIIVTDTKIELFDGDKIFRNNIDITPTEIPKIKEPNILIGDVVQRRIIDGDYVLMNRQPTLWKGSMMAFKTKILPKNIKTFTFNLAVCKAFNSDFDGDEQNAHFPQSTESQIELKMLSTPQECLVSSNGVPVICILQDALLGAYLMTDENAIVISRNSYNDLLMNLTYSWDYIFKRQTEIIETLKLLKIYKNETSLYHGRSIISLIFPRTFNYDDGSLKIKNGVIYEGRLTKTYLGSSKKSLIICLKKEYNISVCVDFINNIQFITNKWLLYNSFSVNISDCYQNQNTDKIIDEKLLEAEFINKNILNEKLKEVKINIILSNAKDVGMIIAKDDSNNFVTTIQAGSKGDYFNLGQVKGLLGQQILNGKRIDNLLDNNTRSLIHYDKNNLSLRESYESRGFIMNSFYNGLNPQEFFFHSMSGRQGVCDTAMTTFMSGYNMRKLVKLTEDIKIQNDGTVCDSSKNIYSYIYGDIGFNPETRGINVDGILEKLNNE